jgi:hypothetical protein
VSNWNLMLSFDWNTYQGNSFLGRFSTKVWIKDQGIVTPDFIAADIKGGDTITISLQEVNNLPVKVSQVVVIFTKQAGAGSEACSPIVWTDPGNTNAKPIPLGMVIFQPSTAAPIPPGSTWSTAGCPTYPPGVTMAIPPDVSNNAFESTVCVEIWDDRTTGFTYKGFFTHDPDMDVTT